MAWGLSGPLQPLTGGARNPVFRCGDVVLKATRRSEAALDWLTQAYRMARLAGLRTPTPIRARTGNWAQGGWSAERYIPGQPASRRDLTALVPHMKQLHRQTTRLDQRPGFVSARQAAAGQTGGDIDMAALPSPLKDHICAALAALPREMSLVHGDLNPGNVIVSAEGPVLIDWDEARMDHPAFDLVALEAVDAGRPEGVVWQKAAEAWEIAVCWKQEPERAQRLTVAFNTDWDHTHSA